MVDPVDDAAPDFDELEALLPWYATGKLGIDDTARVERHLPNSPRLQAALGRIGLEMAATVSDATSLGMPSASALDRLLRETRPASHGERPRAGQLVGKFGERIAAFLHGLTPRELGAVAAVAGLLIALQAGSLLYLAGGADRGVRYETASRPPSPTIDTTHTYAIVAFKPEAPIGDIVALLQSLRIEAAEGPSAGIWRLRLRRETLSAVDAQKLLDELKRRGDLVAFAALAR